MYLAIWRHQEVAVKLLSNEEQTEEQVAAFQKEAELMKKIRPHKNVLQLLGVCHVPLAIITE